MEGEDDACISVLGVALPPFGFILCVIVLGARAGCVSTISQWLHFDFDECKN